ncbi:MAG: hypothetical protein IV100_30930 [Myxococcales bacterium]|nr:hypothetical protein [Myxococcales bacterium]
MAANTVAAAGATLAIMAGAAALSIATWWARGGPRVVALRAIRLAAPLALMGVAHLVFMGALAHVVAAGSNSRYGFTAVAAIGTALALGAMVLIHGVAPGFANGLCRTLLVALVPVVAAVHGAPGTSTPREQLDAAWGAPARQLLDTGCTHVLGTGAHVWPTVFVALLLESHDDRAAATRGPWGLEFRDGPTSHLWRGWPRESFRIAFLREDARWVLDTLPRERSLGVLELVETKPHIEVYRLLPAGE